MSLESAVFERKSLIKSKLAAFGFKKKGKSYVYSRKFLEDAFEAMVTVSEKGEVTGRVIDLDTDDEYALIHMPDQNGAFVARVRESYLEILRQIAADCFKAEQFLKPQTNRICAALEQKYGEVPDYPFAKLPTYGVIRYPLNKKWYALIMNIRRSLLDKNAPEGKRDEIIEIVNIKIDESKRDELLKIRGIYPGYHMGHSHWLSIVLDDLVADDLILELIEQSRAFAVGKRAQVKGERQHWIIPANPEFFDVMDYFSKNREVTWKQSARLAAGDIAYIYLTAPVSEIRFKCEVLKADIPYEYEDEHLKIKSAVKLKVLKRYPDGWCSIGRMRELGIKAIRGQRTCSEELTAYLEKQSE